MTSCFFPRHMPDNAAQEWNTLLFWQNSSLSDVASDFDCHNQYPHILTRDRSFGITQVTFFFEEMQSLPIFGT